MNAEAAGGLPAARDIKNSEEVPGTT